MGGFEPVIAGAKEDQSASHRRLRANGLADEFVFRGSFYLFSI